MPEPRIIKYKSDKLVAEGKYMQAVFESLKESGMLSIQRNRKVQDNMNLIRIYNQDKERK